MKYFTRRDNVSGKYDWKYELYINCRSRRGLVAIANMAPCPFHNTSKIGTRGQKRTVPNLRASPDNMPLKIIASIKSLLWPGVLTTVTRMAPFSIGDLYTEQQTHY